MKKKLLPALIVSITAALAGCQVAPQNQQMAQYGGYGALAGAVAGAVINHDNRSQGALIGGAIGAAGGGFYGNHLDEQAKALRSQTLGEGVSIVKGQDRLDVILAGNQFFQPGSSQLSPNAIRILDSIAQSARQFPNSRVEVTGYSDGVGSPYDRAALSQKRANAASMYLQSQGIDISRLALFNVNDPSPANRSAERRLEIAVLPGPQAIARGYAPQPQYQHIPSQPQYQGQPQYQAQRQAPVQPQRHINVYTPHHYSSNVVQDTLGNGILQGVAGALQNGPAAGLATGLGHIARGATQQATRTANQSITGAIRDAVIEYGR